LGAEIRKAREPNERLWRVVSCVQLLSQTNAVSQSSSSSIDTSSAAINTSTSSVNGKLPIARLMTTSQTQKPARTLAKLLPQTSQRVTSKTTHSLPASTSHTSSSSSAGMAGTAVMVSETVA